MIISLRKREISSQAQALSLCYPDGLFKFWYKGGHTIIGKNREYFMVMIFKR